MKTLSIEDSEFMKYWADRGIRVAIKSMGMERWMTMVPETAFAEPENRLPALLVLHTEHYDDPW